MVHDSLDVYDHRTTFPGVAGKTTGPQKPKSVLST